VWAVGGEEVIEEALKHHVAAQEIRMENMVKAAKVRSEEEGGGGEEGERGMRRERRRRRRREGD